MPQMSPLLWLPLFFFFIGSLSLFLIFNYFIKPFNMINTFKKSTPLTQPLWKL